MDPQARLDISFGALPMLAALCHKPMNRIELRRRLQVSASVITKYLGELRDHGFIVERLDRRFQIIVAITYAKPEVGGRAVPVDPKDVPVAPLYTPPEPALEAAGAPPGPPPEPDEPVVKELPPRAPDGRYKRPPVSHKAVRISQVMNLPAWIANRGEVSMEQQLGNCAGCGSPTPFRYGLHVICPKCARIEAKV